MYLQPAWAWTLVLICLPAWAEDKTSPPPPAAATSGPQPRRIEPPAVEDVERTIRRGVEFLLLRQNQNGSWGSADSSRPAEVYAPVPGAHQAFRAAVTALCLAALIEAGGDEPDVARAIDRGELWLFAELPKVRRASPDTFYNSWTHAYGIQALVRLLGRRPDNQLRGQKIRELIAQQIDMLDRYEVVNGGWAYYDFEAHTQKPSGSTISPGS